MLLREISNNLETGIDALVKFIKYHNAERHVIQFLSQKRVLYRGMSNEYALDKISTNVEDIDYHGDALEVDMIYVQERTSPRKSLFTGTKFVVQNFIYRCMENEYRDVVDRRYSTFCTEELANADGFGSIWCVIPLTNKFSLCKKDFNEEENVELARELALDAINRYR